MFIELDCGIIDTLGLKAVIKLDRPVSGSHDLELIYNGLRDIRLTFKSEDVRDKAYEAIKKRIIN